MGAANGLVRVSPHDKQITGHHYAGSIAPGGCARPFLLRQHHEVLYQLLARALKVQSSPVTQGPLTCVGVGCIPGPPVSQECLSAAIDLLCCGKNVLLQLNDVLLKLLEFGAGLGGGRCSGIKHSAPRAPASNRARAALEASMFDMSTL